MAPFWSPTDDDQVEVVIARTLANLTVVGIATPLLCGRPTGSAGKLEGR